MTPGRPAAAAGLRACAGAVVMVAMAGQVALGQVGGAGAATAGTQDIAAGPGQFIVDFNRQVSAQMGVADLSDADRRARFAALLDEGLDLDAVGEHLLGWRWTRATPAMRARFDREFRGYLIATFALRTTGMDGGRITVLGTRHEGATLVVLTQVETKEAAEVPFAWRVVHGAFGWRLCDIVVKDVSIAAVMRSQFDALLLPSSADFQSLLRLLHEKSLG